VSSLTVTIPGTIDRRLSPNGRAHWRAVRPLQRERKESAYQWTRVERMEQGYIGMVPPLVLDFTIGWEKGRKRMDDDNAKASMKAIIDGIAEALDVNDKHITVGTLTQERDPAGAGYIRVDITEVDHA
jgi:hypothetical protein